MATCAPTRSGALPGLIEGAGFTDVAVRDEISTVYGTLTLLSARRPA